MTARNAEFDVAVIGAGAAGLTAAIHSAATGVSVVCFEQANLYGGLIANVGRLDDYPAPGGIAGGALSDLLLGRVRELAVSIVPERVTTLACSASALRLGTESEICDVKTIILACGGKLRQIGVPGEIELAGRGVSQCDWCDGGLYRGRDVVVVGGGDAALQAALHLSELCNSVAIVARGATLRARRDYVLRAADNERISFHWETMVEAILGHNEVEAVRLRSLSDDSDFEYPCAGVFIFAGIVPHLDFAPAELKTDSAGWILTDRECRTSIPGIFAVGAVRSGHQGTLLCAMGEAAAASAMAAEDLHRRALL